MEMFLVSTELAELVVASVSGERREPPLVALVLVVAALLAGFALRGIEAAQLLMPDRNFSPLLPLGAELLRK